MEIARKNKPIRRLPRSEATRLLWQAHQALSRATEATLYAARATEQADRTDPFTNNPTTHACNLSYEAAEDAFHAIEHAAQCQHAAWESNDARMVGYHHGLTNHYANMAYTKMVKAHVAADSLEYTICSHCNLMVPNDHIEVAEHGAICTNCLDFTREDDEEDVPN